MHLGMSGSFRVISGGEADAGRCSTTSARTTARTTTSCSGCRRGATIALQRSAPLRLHEAVSAPDDRRAAAARARSAPSRSATNSTRADAGRGLRRQGTPRQGGAARPARRRRPRQHLCLRGAAPRADLAAAAGVDAGVALGRAARAHRPAGRCDQGGAQPTRSRPAARRCATTGRPTASSAYFQHRFRVYDREGKPCPTRGCSGTIKRIVQSGRSTFFCPVCQK